jgi:hypothetical protein
MVTDDVGLPEDHLECASIYYDKFAHYSKLASMKRDPLAPNRNSPPLETGQAVGHTLFKLKASYNL